MFQRQGRNAAVILPTAAPVCILPIFYPVIKLLFRCVLVVSTLGATGTAQAQPVKKAVPPVNPYAAVDAKVSQIPDSSTRTVAGLARYINASFSTEGDKARAAFVWVAKNIRYDVDNQYAVIFFRNPSDVIAETLAKRIGVCMNYAEVYSAVANLAGVKTYPVPGYTKSHGEVAQVGHEWAATRIDGQWYLMDPTWAAGMVAGDRFIPRLNNEYFRAAPASFGRSHLPFDPLWQLVTVPRTPQQFQQGTAPGAPARPFHFADSVAAYERQAPLQQLRATNRRVQQNGVKNGLIFNYLGSTRQLEENLHVAAYNEALAAFNSGINKLNEFIEFFNRQFQPRKTDEELRVLLDPLAADLARSRQLLASARSQEPLNQASQKEFQESLRQAEDKLRNCQAFMERYLHSGKLMRPLLFRNISGLSEMMR